MNRIHRMVRETRWKRVQGRAAVCRGRAAGLPKHVFQRVSRTNRRFLTGGPDGLAGRAGWKRVLPRAPRLIIPVRTHDQTIIVVVIVGAQGGIVETRVLPIHPAPCRGAIKRARREGRRGSGEKARVGDSPLRPYGGRCETS